MPLPCSVIREIILLLCALSGADGPQREIKADLPPSGTEKRQRITGQTSSPRRDIKKMNRKIDPRDATVLTKTSWPASCPSPPIFCAIG